MKWDKRFTDTQATLVETIEYLVVIQAPMEGAVR